jgi:hypothetical protein
MLRFMGDKVGRVEDSDCYVKSVPPPEDSAAHKVCNIWRAADGKYRIEWEDDT